MTLDKLRPGKSGHILSIQTTPLLKKRLLDLGLTPGTLIFMQKTAPLGDPLQLYLRGYTLTLRLQEARNVIIREVKQ